jgi:hypothetical protein
MTQREQHAKAMGVAVKGTVIALAVWLVLYVAKEQFGRTAALVLAAAMLLLFVLGWWVRAAARRRGRS